MKRLNSFLQNMSKKSWLSSSWFIAVILIALTYVILSSVLLFHRTTFFTNLDNVNQFYTWYQKLAISWHHGYLPIWNANVYSGNSFAGELQPGVFYPLNWLWVAVFGSAAGISQAALNFLVAFHFWLAAFGCYLLIKELGAHKWAAFLSGVTFAFSGMLAFRSIAQTVVFFGFALLPYSIYFLVKFHNQNKKRYLICSGISLGLLVLVGHIDPFFFALVAMVILEISYILKGYKSLPELVPKIWRSVKSFLLVGIFALIIASPQVWISAPYLGNSYRIQAAGFAGPGEKITYGEFSKDFNINVSDFNDLIDPVSYPVRDTNDFYIGLVPLVVILLGWYLVSKKIRETTIWEEHSFFVTSLLVFSFVSMIGYITWFAVVLYELPFVYQVRELGRYAVLFDLGLAIMLAAALQALSIIKLTRRQRRNLLLIGLFLLVNALYLFLLRHRVFSAHFALQVGLLSLMLLVITLFQSSVFRRVALTFLVIMSALVNTLWYLPNITSTTETPAEYKLPSSLVNVLEQTNGKYRVEIDDNALPVNIGNVYNVQTTGGYSATIYAPYFRIVNLSDVNKSFLNDILGVELVATKEQPHNAKIVYSSAASKLYIYQRTTALPKMFTVDSMGSTSRKDYHGLQVSTIHYDDQTQTFRVKVNKSEEVILSEIYYPGWQATVDGKRVPIQDYGIGGYPLLKSLYLSAGYHTVNLTYKPFKLF